MVVLQSMLTNTDINKTDLNINCVDKTVKRRNGHFFSSGIDKYSIYFDDLKCLLGSSYIGAITVLKKTVHII